MTDQTDSFTLIRAVLNEQFIYDAKHIEPHTSFDELGLDSLDLIDLKLQLSDRSGIDLPDAALLDCRCVAELAALLDQMKSAQTSGVERRAEQAT